MLSETQAAERAADLVRAATKAGATAADAMIGISRSSGISVRLGAIEDIDHSEGFEVGLRLFVGQRSATVSSASIDPAGFAELAERAHAMAVEAPEDPYAGLADPDLLGRDSAPDLDLVDDSAPALSLLEQRARSAEEAARAVAGVTNSNGASAGLGQSLVALATSAGFAHATRGSQHSISASVVAGEAGSLQRDYAAHSTRHFADLDDPEQIGRLAGERAVARLDPVRPPSGTCPIIFDPRVASTLLGHLVAAITGSAIARKTSFLLDALGTQLFAPGIIVRDDPLRRRGLRSRAFDGEGLPCRPLDIVADGILTSWLAASADARQLGIRPTGHAGRSVGGSPGAGPSNLMLMPGAKSREDLLASVPRAILVTELIGQGVNPVTGDYSRGAAGFLVENGKVGAAVAEITIAGNLKDMFRSLEPASDLELRRGMDAPTLLIPEMTVASA
ncbi:metallopeptidase TldD-related protein [Sphingomonas sp. LHG3406-1]|uniref:TldD/PmbA family protein n=1 Tax=Sphingomonas sp. LHG3406-1 TaxID=2804617 RepID=UPI0026167342|nr:metallopeptidase TldD-related protein [Sphingomonas sp. LHG3406-1]